MSTDNQNHPVWGVYDRLRTARLNVKYYSCRLNKIEIYQFWTDIILLASAPSSAIAGLWFWNEPYGQIAWKYLGILAATVSVVKPILNLPKKIKEYESVLSGYRSLEHDYSEIRLMIEQKQKYDTHMQTDFQKALKKEGVLIGKNPETKENKRVKKKCEDEVNHELPLHSFFIPEV